MRLSIILLVVYIFTITLNGASAASVGQNLDKKQTETGLAIFLSSYDWQGGVYDELEIDFSDWRSCGTDDTTKAIYGPTTYIAEPLYLVESTTSHDYVSLLGVNIGGNHPEKTGVSTKTGGVYVNIFKFPIMSMLLEGKTKGVLVFEKGYPKIVYLGVLDPKKWDNVLSFQMNPLRNIYATVQAALTGAVSCMSNTTLDAMGTSNMHNNGAADALRSTIDTIYYNNGCAGQVPFGTDTVHTGPITSGIQAITAVMSDMHSKTGLTSDLFASHTVRSAVNGYDDNILCGSSNSYPTIPITMYTIQMLLPTTSAIHTLGVNPLVYANKNYKGNAEKSVIFAIGKRREYINGAYRN